MDKKNETSQWKKWKILLKTKSLVISHKSNFSVEMPSKYTKNIATGLSTQFILVDGK